VTPGVARARSRPCEFTTIPIISGESPPGVFTRLKRSITASLSAICGTCFGETKLTASICRNPSEINRFRYCTFSCVGITLRKPCQASRGHSTIVTSFVMSFRTKDSGKCELRTTEETLPVIPKVSSTRRRRAKFFLRWLS